ncbi:unnamed protein product [Peronospora destructor]|uniref:Uncharacterized protein n=1 Tax=Peronospora destructor TaxID=86335 RepID=A0AAV0UTB6_9STRA|nr:unnamed protein product [Peronospora destructor]
MRLPLHERMSLNDTNRSDLDDDLQQHALCCSCCCRRERPSAEALLPAKGRSGNRRLRLRRHGQPVE